jgi:UDP-N-acetylglucosamine 1-carboxyvinyltransferase
MDSLLIKGGTPLHGEVTVGGAKNAVLPIMAATLLTAEPCVIRRVPNLSDVTFMGQILTSLGAQVKFEDGTLTVGAAKLNGLGDYDLIRKMRGSICILGPLLARLHKAKVSLPGGCVIGSRPVDLHLKGLGSRRKIPSMVGIIAKAPKLTGTDLFLAAERVRPCSDSERHDGGNLAEGDHHESAAREPE